MSNYWKKKLKELEESKKTSSAEKKDRYWFEKQEALKKEEEKKKNNTSTSQDIAPVREKDNSAFWTSDNAKKDKKREWFEKGAFSDGYQFGDVVKTILGTTSELTTNISAGALGIVEGAVDAGATLLGGVGNAMGFDDFAKGAKDFVKKDIIDEKKWGAILNPLALNSTLGLIGTTADEASLLGDRSDSLLQSGGQLAATIALQGLGVPWWLTTGVTSFGGQAETALNEGASYGQSLASASITAGADVLFEKLSGGIKFGGKTLDDVLLKPLTEKIASKTWRFVTNLGVDTAGEGLEEIFSQAVSNLGTAFYKEDNIKDLLFNEQAMDEYLESFVGGAVLGGVSNVTQSVVNRNRVELTENEQKVFDKVYEDELADAQKSGEVSDKKKREIRQKVLRDMQRGYISTETIEEVLGGETYKAYQDTIKNEDALQEEFKSLNLLKQSDMTGEQLDRRNELKQQLEDLKQSGVRDKYRTQLGDEVMSLVNGSRLAESYNERNRRGQVYTADLKQYTPEQQTTIQKAIDSGILNNTNRTHEFVDMIAKVTADTGVLFDFTNNERLKASGYAVDGKTVNGYVTKDGVMLNIQSAKALESVAGHEITHVLEGSTEYYQLQQAVVRYATAKGEYKSRYDALSKLYKNVENVDIDAELTADLVGDYLFNDSEFVRHLSTADRNVFQKVWDEIKYLCKVATAGSKEARQLEKLKKSFEDAYRATKNTADDSGATKYSIGEIVDENNNSYGIGVHLDSTLLENLTPKERLEMVKERIKELGGEVFTAYDNNGNAVDITIAKSNERFNNRNGKKKPVNKDLTTKYIGNETKQEAVILIDELIVAAKFGDSKASAYPHGWLDNNGQNKWDYWTTYIQDKNNTIWEATLNVANTSDGKKIIYDVSPIKRVGQSVKSDTSLPNDNVAQESQDVKSSISNSSGKGQKNTADDSGAKYSLSDIEISRKYIDYADSSSANIAVEEKVTDLVSRGKTVALSPESIANYETNADWTDKRAVRKLLKEVLEPHLGVTVEFEHEGQSATAYLTRDGINHSVGGAASPRKATAFEMFHSLVKNSEYAFSSENDAHSKSNQKIKENIGWDTFVSVATINGEPYPVVFKIRSIESDVRSQIYEMATKNETGFSHGDGSTETPADAHPNYGTSPISGDNVAQDHPTVKLNHSLSEEGEAPVRRGFGTYGEDIALAPVHNTANANPNAANASERVGDGASLEMFPDDIAPVIAKPTEEAYEAVRPKQEKQPKLVRADSAETTADGKQRKWIKTSTESEAVGGLVTEDDIPDDVRYYQVKSNQKTLDAANARLERYGYTKSREYFEGKMTERKLSVEDIALGERLIQEAAKAGDAEAVRDLIIDVSIIGTELGQRVQALSLIRKLTPEGQLKALHRTIERGKAKGDKAFKDVEVTQEMADTILEARNKDGTYDKAKLDRAVEDVKQQIADKMSVSALDYANAWRYLSMLGNPKTHIRNIVSNVAMLGTRTVKNAIARTIEGGANATVKGAEKLVNKITGKNYEFDAPVENRTKTWKPATQVVKDFAKQTTKEMKATISGETKYSDEGSIKSKRRIFKTPVGNALANANTLALSGEDAAFSRPTFRFTLAEYLTANGVKTEQDIKNNPQLIEQAKDYALEEARRATFQQDSYFATKIAEIERRNPLYGIAIGSTIPFKRTPINVAKTGAAYSPLGLARNIYDAVQVKKGNMDASEAIDHLAQTLTGTALAVLGYALASSNILNGAGEDDKEGEYDYQLGEQSYSFNFNGSTYTLSWLSPVAMPLFVGANAYEQLVEGKEWDGNTVVDALAQTLDPLSEMSFLSSLDDVLSSYETGTQKIGASVGAMAQNYATQFIPTLSSQIASVLDDTKRSTKVSGNSSFKFGEETANKILYKIPGLRNTLEPATDIWGNEVKQTENVLARAAETFVAPYAKKENIATAVDDELKALYRETGKTELLPSSPDNYFYLEGEKYKMSAEEHTAFKKTYGQIANKMLGELFESDTYQNSDSKDKEYLVNKVYDYARDEAKHEYFGDELNSSDNNVSFDGDFAKIGNGYFRWSTDENEWTKISDKQLARQREVTSALGITPGEYWSKTEISVMPMQKGEYEYAYDNPENYAVAKAVGGYDAFRGYSDALNNIHADKDKNGKSITGSRKEKVWDYINNLDADHYTKIILWKSEYPSDDTYNREIIDYLNSREDISHAEMVSILKKLGFTVNGNTITW